MNSRSWRDDELGWLIRHALHDTVGDARPSPQIWQNIRCRLPGQETAVRKPRRWPRAALPGFQACLALIFLLFLVSTLTWDLVPRNDRPLVEPTAPVTVPTSAVVITTDDHPSEPSPVVVRARDMAVRRALATAINRGVFEGTLKRSSRQPVNRQDTTPAQRISLVRARD